MRTVAILFAAMAGAAADAGEIGSLANVDEICAGQPTLEEVEFRAQEIGWTPDENLASEYVDLINEIVSPDDAFSGQSIAMRSHDSGYLVMLDGEWTGCWYRDPFASKAPAIDLLAQQFGMNVGEVEWEFAADGTGVAVFPKAERGLPRHALFVPEGGEGSNFANTGLSIIYEYRKASS